MAQSGEYGRAGRIRGFDLLLRLWEVVSARGREMKKVSVADNGGMVAVSAPIQEVERILQGISEYVVIANINSPLQSVVGGQHAGHSGGVGSL